MAAARDPSRQGALLAAAVVALYLPLQPLQAWLLRAAGIEGAAALDGLARWVPTLVVLLLGAGLAAALAADHRRRRGAGRMRDGAVGLVSGLAVLTFLSALLTLTQAMLTWRDGHAQAVALGVDTVLLCVLGAIAFFAVEPRRGRAAGPA